MQVSNWDHNEHRHWLMRLVVMRHWLLRLPHPLPSEDREAVPVPLNSWIRLMCHWLLLLRHWLMRLMGLVVMCHAACYPAHTCLELLDPSGTQCLRTVMLLANCHDDPSQVQTKSAPCPMNPGRQSYTTL